MPDQQHDASIIEFVTLSGDAVAEYDGAPEGMIPALNETMRVLGCLLGWRVKDSDA